MGGKGFKQYGKTIWPGYSEIEARHVAKVGRNDACPCGSGKKYKDCHEKEGSAWLVKLAADQDRQARREARAASAAHRASLPWYRRWFTR